MEWYKGGVCVANCGNFVVYCTAICTLRLI